jgi:hypothetical protein
MISATQEMTKSLHKAIMREIPYLTVTAKNKCMAIGDVYPQMCATSSLTKVRLLNRSKPNLWLLLRWRLIALISSLMIVN